MRASNGDVFYTDPRSTDIPNLGVAKVGKPETDAEWKTLEWELKSFVCEGEYERGLERILDSFLSHLSQPQQAPAWVSGFYGSGKSHLVRVLEYLWRDVKLPSGETARSMTTLPGAINEDLVELSNAGKRAGGLWSAAGTLGAGSASSVRLAFLAVVLEAADLPSQLAPARLAIWLKQNEIYGKVAEALGSHDKSLHRELRNLYVSPFLADALLEAQPSFAASTVEVSQTLRAQFPNETEIDDDTMLAVLRDVLELQSTAANKLPRTLIVLDEMQQYLGEEGDKALAIQNIVEACASEFESAVLFVATGQSALTATPTLQKLTDRFPVQVALSDTDVETVVRQVILRKKPDQVEGLKQELDSVSGEIDRHLAGTSIQSVAADKADLVPDYPLLPTRRRFWERALRAIDKAGKAGVLRTQLKVVHEAARAVADKPLGYVVGGDFIFGEQAPGMTQSGVLLREMDELIRGLRDGTEDGELKSRTCALIFLIGQLPREGRGDTGLRATAPYIADLLVEGLAHDGAQLRKHVPRLLEELTESGRVMKIDEEYRLQTEEGADWTKDFNQRRAALRDDAGAMSSLRNERLVAAVDGALSGLKLLQGASKTPRRLDVRWGDDQPGGTGSQVPVWIRDGWSVNENPVSQAAAQAGTESPVIHVFLPAKNAEAIRDALSRQAAAVQTTQQRPTPQTDEGRAAREAMETRRRIEEERLRSLCDEVIADAKVFKGGGSPVTESTLRTAIERAAEDALVRLFPKFQVADNPGWANVTKRAHDGAPDALTAIGYTGDPPANPACKEILAAVAGGGTPGSELQKRFGEPSYGWPKDAVNGALLTLLAGRWIRAEQNGVSVGGPKALPPSQIGKTTFFKEDPPPSVQDRLAVRGLLTEAGIPHEQGQEENAVPALLQKLKDLGAAAGGAPPLPAPPETPVLDELFTLKGNQQVRAVAKNATELKQMLKDWSQAAELRRQREGAWAELERLIQHADDLSAAASAREQSDAIKEGRLLLEAPDPLHGVLDDLTDALRAEVSARAEAVARAADDALAGLRGSDEWKALDEASARAILDQVGLKGVSPPDISTDGALLRALDETSLSAWEDRRELVQTRALKALKLAAEKVAPKSITIKLPTTTLKTSKDVEEYLTALRTQIMKHVDDDGNATVIVT